MPSARIEINQNLQLPHRESHRLTDAWIEMTQKVLSYQSAYRTLIECADRNVSKLVDTHQYIRHSNECVDRNLSISWLKGHKSESHVTNRARIEMRNWESLLNQLRSTTTKSEISINSHLYRCVGQNTEFEELVWYSHRTSQNVRGSKW